MMIKAIHITMAYLTVTGFVLRAVWAFVDPTQLQQRWVRIAPHVVDTVLLLCGLWLANQNNGWPDWLLAKLGLLLLYIVFGALTLRCSGILRNLALIGALGCVALIFALAFNQPLELF